MAFQDRESQYPSRRYIGIEKINYNIDGTIKSIIADVDYYQTSKNGTRLNAENLSKEVVNTVLERLYGITSITQEVVVSTTKMEKIEIIYDKTMTYYADVIALGGDVVIGNIDERIGKIIIYFEVYPHESGYDSSFIIPKAMRVMIYSDENKKSLVFKYDVSVLYVYTGENTD